MPSIGATTILQAGQAHATIAGTLWDTLLAIIGMISPLGAQPAQAIEHELVLITPGRKTPTDPALAEFTRYARQNWNLTVKVSAIAAGTPIAEDSSAEYRYHCCSERAHPKAARAFVELMLSALGQQVVMDRGLFPINPTLRLQGVPGSTTEIAVEFVGGIRSYFEREVINVYDEELTDRRYEEINTRFRREIESVWQELKKKY